MTYKEIKKQIMKAIKKHFLAVNGEYSKQEEKEDSELVDSIVFTHVFLSKDGLVSSRKKSSVMDNDEIIIGLSKIYPRKNNLTITVEGGPNSKDISSEIDEYDASINKERPISRQIPTEKNMEEAKESFNKQPPYLCSGEALQRVSDERKCNGYIYDVVKRLERGMVSDKDVLKKDIQKSIDVLAFWLSEIGD